jgi:hypothetical protein
MKSYSEVLELHHKQVIVMIADATIQGTFYMGSGCGNMDEYGLHFDLGNPVGKTGRKYYLIAKNFDATQFTNTGMDRDGIYILIHNLTIPK